MARHRSFKRIGGRVGGFKSMLAPIAAGVADSYLDPMLPIDGIGASAIGILMKNNTTRDIGLYKVGMSLGNILPLPKIGGQSQGGLL